MSPRTRERKSPLRGSNHGNGRKLAGQRTRKKDSPTEAKVQADDCLTTRERFSRPANDLIALIEETALSIALRSEIYYGAAEILHRVNFTIPRNVEIAERIHRGIVEVLCRKTEWKAFRATLHAEPEIAELTFAAFPRLTFTEAEGDLHRSLKTFIAEL